MIKHKEKEEENQMPYTKLLPGNRVPFFPRCFKCGQKLTGPIEISCGECLDCSITTILSGSPEQKKDE